MDEKTEKMILKTLTKIEQMMVIDFKKLQRRVKKLENSQNTAN